MDHYNRYESKTTYNLLRLEFGIILAVASVLFVVHLHEVRWIPAIILFVYIDVIGYIPGLIAYFMSPTREVPRVFYVLYNAMHSITVQAAVVAVWVAISGWEWALLVVPIHLCGDRALFGNFMKTFTVPFEPKKTSAFAWFEQELANKSKRSPAAAPQRVS